MSPGPTFERVYLALKEKVVSGAFAPGSQLEPAALSGDLVASITPVRDALHRLAGERLVHTPRADGFRMPIYTEAALRDLYLWNGRLLHLAVAARHVEAQSSQPPDQPHNAAEETARLFAAIARLSASPEQVATIAGLNDRLHAVRLQEARLLHWQSELAEIASALASGSWPELRRLVGIYHRRRIGIVSRLIEQLQPSL